MKRGSNKYKYMPNWWKKIAVCCPLCNRLLFSARDQYRVLKGIVGFFYGISLGYAFYNLVITQLDIQPVSTYILGTLTAVLLGFGCAVSSQLRCTVLLTFPNFGSKTGRSTLRALAIAYIIAGPVANLTTNAAEVVRTFACTTSLTYNLTKTKYVLMFKPFQNALMNLKADTSEVKETLNSIKGVVKPIKYEMEDDGEVNSLKEENDYLDTAMNDTKRSEAIEKKYDTKFNNKTFEAYEKKYFKKLEYRCDNVISAAGTNCRKMFEKAHDNCYNNVPWGTAWILCWPMKLTFICDVVTAVGGDNVCDPSRSLSSGFGSGYEYIIKSRDRLSQEFKGGHIQYKIERPNIPLDIRGASDTAQAVVRAFQQKRGFVEIIILYLKRILVFVFIRIILNAQDFHEKYLRDIEHQNIYITKYFKKIDARRFKNGKHTLLPLKKMEKQKLINPYSLKFHSTEMNRLTANTIKLALEMMTATTIILIDRVFYETLLLVQQHAKIDFEQVGSHVLIISVHGTGLIASIVRSVVGGFNINKSVNKVYSNERCLPKPKLLSLQSIRQIYGMYLFVFILTIVEGYSSRISWFICSYFYPKQEKKRVLHLYNMTMKARIGFFKYMQAKVQRMVKQNKVVIRSRLPADYSWSFVISCL
ncbi:ubiquitin protein ligase sneaky isoform X2 [Rhodnius prolixus]|uniref:ubiquitin protein ligase sneaky isoform X2 n=1 Tax=Rhodnius prolixus TaxID=13249 RepID=UPI003D18BC60